jgi:uncharacterized protein YbjQ (UPF0145 family)
VKRPDFYKNIQSQKGETMMIVTTTNDVADHRIVRYLGVVRGITVRSRNVFGTVGAQFQSLFGGNITLYTELAERARQEAYDLMVGHASADGADAVIAMRYDANEIAAGITEVLAYGTAVVLEKPAP